MSGLRILNWPKPNIVYSKRYWVTQDVLAKILTRKSGGSLFNTLWFTNNGYVSVNRTHLTRMSVNITIINDDPERLGRTITEFKCLLTY